MSSALLHRWVLPLCSVASIAFLSPTPLRADVNHVVAPNQTLDVIARRYHVTSKAIADANKHKDLKHLKPGDTLVIPGVHPPGKKPSTDPKERRTPQHVAPTPPAKGPNYAAVPKQPNVVHANRFGEEFSIRVKDRRGKIPPPALKAFERLLRSGNATHAIDPRLIALVGLVSNRFGGRKIELVSGYRPFTPTQFTAHSNHNFGKALDFRVQGVPNEVLRDFCKTLRNVGVGYYPNSQFVHLDVRDAPTYWVDYSRPGEAPKYDRPNADADEGTSDVPDDSAHPPARTP